MLKFTRRHNGWEITKRGQILFSKIKTLSEALAIVKVHGLVWVEIDDKLKEVA